MQGNPSAAVHTLTLSGRSTAALTGVEDVDCFNEQIIVLRTSLGMLTITGEGLNIHQLNLEEGRLIVEGDLNSVEYDRKRPAGSGFWARLFG